MGLDRMLTTENGRPVPQPFVFMDGKLTLMAPHRWDYGFLSDHGHTALDYDGNYEERIEFVDDPLTVGTAVSQGSQPRTPRPWPTPSDPTLTSLRLPR